MGFRFRQRIRVAPGVYINLSKRGVSSASIGGNGLTLNVGRPSGPTVTASIPGTGLSYTQSLRGDSRTQQAVIHCDRCDALNPLNAARCRQCGGRIGGLSSHDVGQILIAIAVIGVAFWVAWMVMGH